MASSRSSAITMMGPSVMNFTRPPKNGRSLMHRVKALRLRFGEPRHAQRQNLEAGLLDHGQDLAGLPGGHGIGFDDGKVRSTLISEL